MLRADSGEEGGIMSLHTFDTFNSDIFGSWCYGCSYSITVVI